MGKEWVAGAELTRPGNTFMNLVLASGSPRRHQLLANAGFLFEIVRPHVEEIPLPGEAPLETAVRLALAKARDVTARVGPNRLVVGVDTVVSIGDRILGKPLDQQDATEMLLQLSDRTHTVYSGYAIVGFGDELTGVDGTRVTMRSISRAEAAAYSATGEPLDKAGAYAIQGGANRFITAVDGSRSNVMGLPLEAFVPLLAARGIESERPAGDTSGRKDP
ncbi:MAG: Maf family protein [Acidimicrobiia bacterium]